MKSSNNKNLLITRGVICFPNIEKDIEIAREASINVINDAYDKGNKEIIITAQINPKLDTVKKIDEIYNIGVIAKITKISRSDNEITITVTPKARVLISNINIDSSKNLTKCEFTEINDQQLYKIDESKEFDTLLELLNRYDQKITARIRDVIIENEKKNKQNDFIDIVYQIADLMPIHFDQKQQILALNTLPLKIDALTGLLSNPADLSKVEKDINRKLNESLSKQQREFYLREKMRTIKEELGEISSRENDSTMFRKKLRENPYPKQIKEKLESEINHLESSNPQESSMIRTYIEWLLNIPWWQENKDNNDFNKVKKTLDTSHYGLEKVKERIVEYLAVRAKSKNTKAPIICLVGPPGVGKSSLAKSIADALNKPFVKMALGGVKDESEIRGHRRTYLGSMPGRIIKAMKKAGVVNPLFLLDEIDKMSSDQRGDPASAMLEVLDPEQNSRFSDNYIEEDYDLSKVMFVATANYAEQIPAALYDRLEIIELTSYTELEKLAIAKKYLIPKVLKDSGLTNKDLSFKDDALMFIIRHYTQEAGVRELERMIRKIARKLVVEQLTNKKKTTKVIDKVEAKFYLDKEIYEYNIKEKVSIPGVVNGMAYTSAGGDLLQIEVTHYKGKGGVNITGNLKETMKESAQVALAFVKANAKRFGIKDIDFAKTDIHIHVPTGGVPKDGPSAGVTLTTAIISALSNRPVKSTLSMTGEITLRGKVLIIGGVKEKTISAHRGGVNTIIIPARDERFLKDVPPEVKDNITVYLVEHYDEIYNIVFNGKPLKETKIIKGKNVK